MMITHRQINVEKQQKNQVHLKKLLAHLILWDMHLHQPIGQQSIHQVVAHQAAVTDPQIICLRDIRNREKQRFS